MNYDKTELSDHRQRGEQQLAVVAKATAAIADRPCPFPGGEFEDGWNFAMEQVRDALGRAPLAYRRLGHPDWIDELP